MLVFLQKETLHRDASVTLTMTFSAEHIEILAQVRGLMSHCKATRDWLTSVPMGSWLDVPFMFFERILNIPKNSL